MGLVFEAMDIFAEAVGVLRQSADCLREWLQCEWGNHASKMLKAGAT